MCVGMSYLETKIDFVALGMSLVQWGAQVNSILMFAGQKCILASNATGASDVSFTYIIIQHEMLTCVMLTTCVLQFSKNR